MASARMNPHAPFRGLPPKGARAADRRSRIRARHLRATAPAERLAARAEELARSLAQGPTRTFGSAKRLLHSGWDQSLETQMELESRAIAEAGETADGKEGIAAFVEKRKAKFVGK